MPFGNYQILLADDNENDRFLIERALKRFSPGVVVKAVSDGQSAIAYLSGKPPYDDRTQHPFPDVLILDLTMPRMNGFEVLEWLREQALKGLQVMILSGSDHEADREKAHSLGAHIYLVKHEDASITAQAVARLLRDFTPSSTKSRSPEEISE